MIEHQIITYKPRVKALVQVHTREGWTQEQLDAALKNCPFKVGDVVSFCQGPIDKIYFCHIVTDLQTKAALLEYDNYQMHQAKYLQIQQLQDGRSNIAQYPRWSSRSGLRKVTQDEYERIVKPVLHKKKSD